VIRPEYVKLADGLPSLARQFGCALPAAVARDLREFTLALECIDRVLDDVADAGARARLSRAILDGLDGGGGARVDRSIEDAELVAHVERLAALVRRRAILPAFRRLGARALDNTERMRTTRDAREFIACVQLEGRLTVELTLLVAGPHLDGDCARFLRGVAELCNLYDKLKDARGDFRRGEMALPPGARLHARLVGALLRRLATAARLHPHLGGFVRWGLGYL
jgi:hypothetical protein